MNYIILNGQRIEYRLTRNAKRNVNISIKDNGIVNVSAPKRVSISEVEGIVVSKQDWILKALKRLSSKTLLSNEYSFDAHSTLYYLGREFKIECVASNSNSLEILEDRVKFFVKKSYINNVEYKNRVFNRLLKEDLEIITTGILIKYLKLTSKEVLEFKIRDMKSRWGTCIPSKKEIILNFNLVHCPLDAIEYVVLHEVTHLIHANHSRSFYNTIEMYMPDWNIKRKKLRDYTIS